MQQTPCTEVRRVAGQTTTKKSLNSTKTNNSIDLRSKADQGGSVYQRFGNGDGISADPDQQYTSTEEVADADAQPVTNGQTS